MVATDEAQIYTVVLRMRSYLITAEEAESGSPGTARAEANHLLRGIEALCGLR
jgi:hypothetical protein